MPTTHSATRKKRSTAWMLQGPEKKVLRTIWLHGSIARIDIAQKVGLGNATVTRAAANLMNKGLVQESVHRTGLRGQPIRPLALRSDGAFSVGVYFSHSYMDVGLVNLSGEIVCQERAALPQPTPQQIASIAYATTRSLLKRSRLKFEHLVGVGVAVPGDFDITGRRLQAHSYFPDLKNCDLSETFGPLFPVAVYIENDGTSAAVGERVNGVGRALSTFLFIHIGHGVGGGLIMDGRLYRGRHGNAALAGCLFPIARPRPSGQDLFETLQTSGIKIYDFNGLEDDAIGSHPVVLQWTKRAAKELEFALRVGTRFLDPDAIVLGGRLPPWLLKQLVEALNFDTAFEDSHALPIPQIHCSALGPNAGVLGAASICIFRFFFEM